MYNQVQSMLKRLPPTIVSRYQKPDGSPRFPELGLEVFHAQIVQATKDYINAPLSFTSAMDLTLLRRYVEKYEEAEGGSEKSAANAAISFNF